MKIKIITIHNIHNFGSVFQAYALNEYLKNCGYEVEIIDYNPPYFRYKSFKTYLGQCLNLKAYMQRKKRFRKFVKENIPLTSINYLNYQGLKENPPDAELYIVGGDQLWNSYHSCGRDDAYKLSFVSGNKISYGTSMGRTLFSKEELEELAKKLNDFKFVSVRERSSVDLLKSVGVKASHVVDPVLLLTCKDYKNFLIKPYRKEKYLFVYLVSSSDLLNHTVRYISKKLNLKVVLYAGLSKKCECDYLLKNLGPEEILSYIVNAEFVLSASFHATLFSIMFHKQFATLLPDLNTNERIEDLLNWTQLEERIVRNHNDLNPNLLQRIHFDDVDVKLNEKIQLSKLYLTNSIKQISEDKEEKEKKSVLKTITVTSNCANNYGAVLQAYALQQVQESIGYENKILDYYEPPRLFLKCFSKEPSLLLKNIVMNFFTLIHLRKVKSFKIGFDRFRKQYLKQTRRYDTFDQFCSDIPKVDCFITGSDQVWNINEKLMSYRFLDFETDTILKYSYAASMSNFSLTNQEKRYIREKLKSFNGLSVREEKVQKYFEEFTNFQYQRNIDPVFLLDKETWKNFAKMRRNKEPYILCYVVLGNKNLQKILNQLKKRTHLPIISLQSSAIKHVKADQYIFDADPREFLGLFYHAEFIITTSFHGTAFSIIFEKKFYTLIKSSMSERMKDLLKLFELTDRVLTKEEKLSLQEIDYSKTRNIINMEKKSAIEYLKSIQKNKNELKEY